MTSPGEYDPIDAWLRLPSRQRHEAERAALLLRPHPDPRVAAAAAGFASARLRGQPHIRWRALARRSMSILIIIAAVFGIQPLLRRSHPGAGTIVATLVVMLTLATLSVWVLWSTVGSLRRSWRIFFWMLLRYSNQRFETGAPVRSLASMPGEAGRAGLLAVYLTARGLRPGSLHASASLFIAAALIAIGLLMHGTVGVMAAGMIVLGVVLLLVDALLVAALMRTWWQWVRRHRPVLIVGAEGIHFARLDHVLHWPDLLEVRLLPSHRSQAENAWAAMAFIPRMPPTAPSVRGSRRIAAKRSERTYGTSLVVGTLGLDREVEEIITVITAHSQAPIRAVGSQ